MIFGIKGGRIGSKSPFLPQILAVWGCECMRQCTPNCPPNCPPNPEFETKRAQICPLPCPRFDTLGAGRSHARLTADLTAAANDSSRRITRADERAPFAAPLPCRPTGTMSHKRRKRLNFALSAPSWLILPAHNESGHTAGKNQPCSHSILKPIKARLKLR